MNFTEKASLLFVALFMGLVVLCVVGIQDEEKSQAILHNDSSNTARVLDSYTTNTTYGPGSMDRKKTFSVQ